MGQLQQADSRATALQRRVFVAISVAVTLTALSACTEAEDGKPRQRNSAPSPQIPEDDSPSAPIERDQADSQGSRGKPPPTETGPGATSPPRQGTYRYIEQGREIEVTVTSRRVESDTKVSVTEKTEERMIGEEGTSADVESTTTEHFLWTARYLLLTGIDTEVKSRRLGDNSDSCQMDPPVLRLSFPLAVAKYETQHRKCSDEESSVAQETTEVVGRSTTRDATGRIHQTWHLRIETVDKWGRFMTEEWFSPTLGISIRRIIKGEDGQVKTERLIKSFP